MKDIVRKNTKKCPNCNSNDIEDVSDFTHEIFICNKCEFYWIVRDEKK